MNRKLNQKLQRLALLVSPLLLLACAGPASQKAEPTLADLAPVAELPKVAALPVSTPDEALHSYNLVLNTSPDPKVRAEALRRLADMTLRLAEQRMLSAADDKLAELSPAQASASFASAIAYYRQLLREYSPYVDVASVHYQLAKAHDLNAERAASQAALADMASTVAVSGQHQQLTEARFRMAEARFSARAWPEAAEIYSAVLAQGPDTGFYEQALYKRGWARFKQQHYEVALEDFFALIARLHNKAQAGTPTGLMTDKPGADKQTQALASDSYRVLALAFAYLDGPASIATWFTEHPRPVYEAEIYRALAEHYAGQERHKDAALSYQTYIDNNPYTVSAPEFAANIIATYERGQYPSLVLPAKEQFARNYGQDSDYARHVDAATMAALQPALKTHVRDVASHYHALAQASRRADDFRLSARWYRQFVDGFPDDSDTPLLHFLLAEALYDAADLAPAAAEFDLVAYRYPRHSKSEPAAYAALLARQQLLQAVPAGDDKVGAGVAARAAAKTSAQAYVQHFPGDAKAANVQASLMAWRLLDNELAPALQSAKALLTMTMATPEQQRTAAIVAANAEFDLGNYAAAEHAYGVALSQAGHELKLQAQFHEQRALAIYKQGEALQTAGEQRAAVEQFSRLAGIEPQAQVRVNADYDAAALLLALNDWPKAIAALQQFRVNFAGHSLQAGIPAKLAYAYEQAGDFGQAAREYLRMEQQLYAAESSSQPGAQTGAKSKGKPTSKIASTSERPQPIRAPAQAKLARDYAWTAGLLFDKALEKAGAPAAPNVALVQETVATWAQYVERYGAPEMPGAELAEHYAPAQQARIRLLQLQQTLAAPLAVSHWQQQLVQAYRPEASAPALRYAVAEAAFALNAPAHARYLAIELKLPLAKTLKAKREALQIALKQYEAVVGYGVAEFTTAAGHRMAELYAQLAQALMSSERPKVLSADALDEYNVLLEEQVLPFEDKAIALFERNLALSKDGHYNDWIKQSLQALAKLNPGRYGKTEQLESFYAATPNVPPAAVPVLADGKATSMATATTNAAPIEPVLTGSAPAAFQHGESAVRAGDFSAAEKYFAQIQLAQPNFLPAYLNRALAARATAQLPLATSILEQAAQHAAEFAKNDARFFTLQGLLAREQGQMEAAKNAYLRALELAPDYVYARRNLALLAEYYLQEPALALVHLTHYAQLVPDDKSVQTWLADLTRRVKARAAPVANSEAKS